MKPEGRGENTLRVAKSDVFPPHPPFPGHAFKMILVKQVRQGTVLCLKTQNRPLSFTNLYHLMQ